MTAGVYKIYNSKNGKFYIGSSVVIEQRLRTHKAHLLKGTHQNINLQADFDVYGKEAFYVEILEECFEDIDRDPLYDKEDYYINLTNAKELGYNIADARAGDMIKYHPNKEQIIKKKTQILAQFRDDVKAGIKEAPDRTGDKNSNWKPDLVRNCIKCGNPLCPSAIAKRNKICGKCRDRTGKNNPFYGKKMSDEHKERLRQLSLNRPAKNRKRYLIEGVQFDSGKAVAEHYQIDRTLVNYRVKSDRYPDWICLD